MLSDQDSLDPIWSKPETMTLLGKGPKFTPTPSSLREADVSFAIAEMNFRLVRAFERFVNKTELERKDAVRRDAGIQDWLPKRRKRSEEECRSYVQDFFNGAREFSSWRNNQGLVPSLRRRMFLLDVGITETVKIGRAHV